MPLKKGASQDTVSSNIKTLLHDYERTGSIGNSHPGSKKKAVKQAVAIAMDKARESGGGRGTARKSTSRSAGKKSSASTAKSR